MKIMKKHQSSMLEGPLFSGVILYTIPIILTSVLQLLFNAADLIVVGKFCGSVSVGAVGATSSLTNLLVNLFIGLSIGAGVAVAHSIGSRDEEQVSSAVHTAVPLALIGGVVLTVVGVLFSEPLLVLMGTPENTLPLSAVYMKIYFAGITFTVVYNFCAAILRAAGDTRSPLIYLTIAGTLSEDAVKAIIGIADGAKITVPDSSDINGSGKLDASDAQYVWNMYKAQYSEFTEDVTMIDFIKADRNADYKIDTTDAAAVVNEILGITTQ